MYESAALQKGNRTLRGGFACWLTLTRQGNVQLRARWQEEEDEIHARRKHFSRSLSIAKHAAFLPAWEGAATKFDGDSLGKDKWKQQGSSVNHCEQKTNTLWNPCEPP